MGVLVGVGVQVAVGVNVKVGVVVGVSVAVGVGVGQKGTAMSLPAVSAPGPLTKVAVAPTCRTAGALTGSAMICQLAERASLGARSCHVFVASSPGPRCIPVGRLIVVCAPVHVCRERLTIQWVTLKVNPPQSSAAGPSIQVSPPPSPARP